MLALQALAQGPSRPAQLQTSRNPHGPLDIPCENCHTSTSWKPIRSIPEFDHDKTRYPLRGMHEKVQCVECHTKLVFKNVGSTCADCHADIHRRQFGANCEQCHTVNGWNVSVQAIQNHFNRFPLVGAHAALECDACHKGAATGQFQGLSTQCYSCHARDFQLAANPNHVNAKFSTTCETCHGMNTWLAATFDHSTTGFMLTNGHANVPCATCHINNNYNLTTAPTDCGNSGCHLTTWQQTNNPVHPSAGAAFGVANCAACHTTKGWDSASFDHSTTGFALTGTHASPSPTPCASCHVSNNYTLNSADCMGCHQAAWNTTPSFGGNVPDHIKAGFPTTAAACAQCHTVTKWSDGKFDHTAFGFPLTNAHALVVNGGKVPACESCHINSNYSLSIMPNDCGNSGCHLSTWQQTNNPTHATSGPTFAVGNCSTCHNTISWTTAIFDHSTTGFLLTNGHANVACAACHLNNNYNLTMGPTDCGSSGCHLTTWKQTNNPMHSTSGPAFQPTNCATCHTTKGWESASFDHSTTGWALTGSHQLAPAG